MPRILPRKMQSASDSVRAIEIQGFRASDTLGADSFRWLKSGTVGGDAIPAFIARGKINGGARGSLRQVPITL